MNSDIIDRPDYYELPCGRQLEDFIWERGLTFFTASALKYRYRAGKKDGEAREKDLAKARHFTLGISRRKGIDLASVEGYITSLVRDAKQWNGERGGVSGKPSLDSRIRVWRPSPQSEVR